MQLIKCANVNQLSIMQNFSWNFLLSFLIFLGFLFFSDFSVFSDLGLEGKAKLSANSGSWLCSAQKGCLVFKKLGINSPHLLAGQKRLKDQEPGHPLQGSCHLKDQEQGHWR